jgi:hypothetical protein
MKINTALCTLLLAALSLGACDKGDKKSEAKKDEVTKTEEPSGEVKDQADPSKPADPTAAETKPADPGATAPTATAASAGSIEILSEGAEPRFQLKYQAPAGTKQKMEMSMDMTMDIAGMGKMTTPTIIMLGDMEVVSVAADGKSTNKMTFTGVEVKDTKDSMPGAGDAIKDAMAKIKGTSTTMVLEPNGKVVSVEVDAPNDPMLAQTMDQAKQGLDKMVTQLPDQAVGKGAKWRVKQTIEQGGIKMDQTIAFEVVEITATTAKLKGVLSMSAPKQTMDQGGISATVEKMDGNGTTELDIDFTKVVPTVTAAIDMDMKMTAMGQAQEMGMSMKMKIRAKK